VTPASLRLPRIKSNKLFNKRSSKSNFMGGVSANHVPGSIPEDQKYKGTLLPDPAQKSWYRGDGSLKGPGYLGMMQRRDGSQQYSGEISAGVDQKDLGTLGKNAPLSSEGYVDIPQMVPGLNRNEIDFLLDVPVNQQFQGNPKLATQIQDKAIEFAKQRLVQGKPIFASPNESIMAQPRMRYKPTLLSEQAIDAGLK
jgi:hypothetical protein